MESLDDNQDLYSNNEENRLELGDILLQKIPKDQKVSNGKDCILIVIVVFCMLCYTKN